jgi:hypothetical protein
MTLWDVQIPVYSSSSSSARLISRSWCQLRLPISRFQTARLCSNTWSGSREYLLKLFSSPLRHITRRAAGIVIHLSLVLSTLPPIRIGTYKAPMTCCASDLQNASMQAMLRLAQDRVRLLIEAFMAWGHNCYPSGQSADQEFLPD